MRKSLNEIQQIENYVLGRMNEQEYQDFQILLFIDAHLQSEVDVQTEAYALIKGYARKKLKAELSAVHERVFNQPDKAWFWQKIKDLFTEKK